MERSEPGVERSYAGLTALGGIAAIVIGACTLAGGSWRFAAVLLAFFIPSTLLSRVGKARKARLVDIGKTGPRDAFQVLANGGVAAFCAILFLVTRNAVWAAGFAGAFAAASADTWGTEIGTLMRGKPRDILTLRPIERGLSGGVTFGGTLAVIAGGLFVAAVAQVADVATWWIVAVSGIAGAFADSIIGAGAQELRYCDACARVCETDPHVCGNRTRLVRGASWMSNDVVNAVCTVVGAAAAALISAAFR